MSTEFDELTTASDGTIDIPNFATEELKPSFPPGQYLFALGKVHPKYDDSGKELLSMNQDIWVLRYDGKDLTEEKEWRIRFDEKGDLYFPSHKGTKRMEFFPNPIKKPKQKWLTSAFYKIFPGVLINTGDPAKPAKECSWKAVMGHYGQVFSAELYKNSYKDDTGADKSSIKLIYDSMMLVDKKISVEQMLRIEGQYDFLKETNTDIPSGASQDTSIKEEDLPF